MQAMEHGNTLVPEPPISRLQRVLKIYCQIKPCLALLLAPLHPLQLALAPVDVYPALDALAVIGPDPTSSLPPNNFVVATIGAPLCKSIEPDRNVCPGTA